jgi:putative spermidine/putrescine transport system permease protein
VRIADSFFLSLWLALAVTLLSMLIAVPAAYALVRLKPAGTDWLLAFFTAPLLLPTIVLGLGLLMVFAPLGLLGSVRGLLFCHMVVTLPYALRVLVTALSTLSPAIEEAAATLGASPAVVLFRITLPMMTPGIVAASVLSFLVSFDEVVVSLFMTGPKVSTLPVTMFHHVEERADPMVAALSVLLVGLTLIVMLVVDRTIGLGKAFVK